MRNLPKKGEIQILISEVLSSPPTPLDAVGFLSLTPQKVSSDSFFILVHSLPFYNDVSGLGFYSFLIAYSGKENEFSLQ